jgi:hypothetical protein
LLKIYQYIALSLLQATIDYRDDRSLVVAEPRSPLKRYVRSCTCYSIDSRRNQRKMSASNVEGCYIVYGTCAFNKSVLLVSPIDTFNAREFSVQTRIIGGISIQFQKRCEAN